MRLIIAGGGYAGLAAVIAMKRALPDAAIYLIDPNTHHLKITHLHETFRRPLDEFRIPYRELAKRLDCNHIQAKLEFDKKTLQRWQQHKAIDQEGLQLAFDYLLIATGSKAIPLEKAPNVYDLDDFCNRGANAIFREFIGRVRTADCHISVVGGGASGIQFLFELLEKLRQQRVKTGRRYHLRLIDDEARVLNQFPVGFDRYVRKRMAQERIDYIPNTFYVGQEGETIVLKKRETEQAFSLPSQLTLLFLGLQPYPELVQANAYGQVVVAGEALENVFAAGDCSRFMSSGANALSAQVAVHKAKHGVKNILRHAGPFRSLMPYSYQEIGYFVSLGPFDGIGWLGLKLNVVAGLPALMIKEAVEARFDLLLAGLDTYFP